MNRDAHSILSTLSALLGASLIVPACASSPAPTEPSRAPTPPAETECLHSEGCCGGHAEGDASCGASKASEGAAEDLQWTVEPGEFAEINVELGSGATMRAAFRSEGGDLRWNVHSHVDDAAVIHDQGETGAGNLSFTAPTAGLYSFLWMNPGSGPVSLQVELDLQGDARVHSKH
jgi:hypothetical protein